MIPESRNIEVSGTLTGEKVGMTIDASSLAKIMTVLTDLYSNPTLAVIREYSTNGFDAHVEAGVSLPIEVTTPTNMMPYFKVRDFGNGLNADDIRDIYSKYGMSTKAHSNDVVGMLGLGCKSALTYTDQFTLTGIKDGIATQVAISRDEDGAGSMTILASYETDEASGVEIVVPVKGDNNFEAEANDFFRFWDEGTVLVNGKEPVGVEGIQVTDDILITTEGVDSSYVVMGNVAYPFDNYHTSYHIIARVAIGDVAFTPSREALQLTDNTVVTIEKIKETAEEAKVTAIQKLVDGAADRWQAMKLAFEAEHTYGVKIKTLSYNGVTFPDRFEVKETKDAQQFVVVTARKGYRSKGWERRSWVATKDLTTVVFMTGYNGSNFTPTKRTKLEMWMDAQTVTQADGTEIKYAKPEKFYLIDKLTKAEKAWIKSENIIDWADIEAIKIPRTGKDGTVKEDGAPSGSYVGYIAGDYKHDIIASEINPSNRKGLFYCDHKQASHFKYVIFSKYPNATIVELTSNRRAKFLRFFPKARSCNTVAQEIVKKWVDTLTVEETLAINFDQALRFEYEWMAKIDESRIQDEALAAVITAYKTRSKVSEKYNTYKNWLRGETFTNLLNDTLANYPLLTMINTYGRIGEKAVSDMIVYLNAAYLVGKEQ